MNLSFAGCGFLGLYHLGVVSCIKTYAPRTFCSKVALPHIPYYTPAICDQVAGASAGSMAAVAVLIDNIDIGKCILWPP